MKEFMNQEKKKGKTKLGLIAYRSCISGKATIYKWLSLGTKNSMRNDLTTYYNADKDRW